MKRKPLVSQSQNTPPEPVTLKVRSFKSVTTNEDLLKTGGNLLDLVEYGKTSLVFELPGGIPRLHTMVMVSGAIHFGSEVVEFQFIGKMNAAGNAENSDRIQFDLIQYDKALWLKFIRQSQEKQARADRILKIIKGDTP